MRVRKESDDIVERLFFFFLWGGEAEFFLMGVERLILFVNKERTVGMG